MKLQMLLNYGRFEMSQFPIHFIHNTATLPTLTLSQCLRTTEIFESGRSPLKNFRPLPQRFWRDI